MSEIKKSGDPQGVRILVGEPGKVQDSVLSEAVSLGMKKVRTSVIVHTQRYLFILLLIFGNLGVSSKSTSLSEISRNPKVGGIRSHSGSLYYPVNQLQLFPSFRLFFFTHK